MFENIIKNNRKEIVNESRMPATNVLLRAPPKVSLYVAENGRLQSIPLRSIEKMGITHVLTSSIFHQGGAQRAQQSAKISATEFFVECYSSWSNKRETERSRATPVAV